jgi:hypothetical protein
MKILVEGDRLANIEDKLNYLLAAVLEIQEIERQRAQAKFDDERKPRLFVNGVEKSPAETARMIGYQSC